MGEAAAALVEQGVALERAGRTGEALAAFEEVLERFGDSDDLAARHPVARAAAARVALEDLGRDDEAIAAFGAFAARYADAPETQ